MSNFFSTIIPIKNSIFYEYLYKYKNISKILIYNERFNIKKFYIYTSFF